MVLSPRHLATDTTMKLSQFADEWTTLQDQYDRYEMCSLLIKIISICIVAAALMSNTHHILMAAVIVVLWLQDAIWKTYQARTEARLLQVEEALEQEQKLGSTEQLAYCYNRWFLENRRSGTDLIKEYLRQAIRPTILFPYAPLIMILVAAQVSAGLMSPGW
jgi:hypothetical protein